MAAFDHDRPLWEFTLVEGLPEGRGALVMKVHHALTDGIGGIQIAAHVVDLEREPADLGPCPTRPSAPDHGPLDALADALGVQPAPIGGHGAGSGPALPRRGRATVRHPIARCAATRPRLPARSPGSCGR